VKDAWNYLAEGKTETNVKKLMRPVLFSHQTKKIDKLLAEFQQTRNNMAVVVDDYGGMLGIVTLEDLLEEIVGEIVDESEAPMITKMANGIFEADGKASLSEVNQILKTKWTSKGFNTISGFIIEKLDRLPAQNEKISEGNYTLKAIKVKEPKILRIKIERKIKTGKN